MWKLLKILLAGVAVSFYFFPFEFTFLPGVNTKMAMAGVGLGLFAIDIARGRAPRVNKDGFVIAVIGVLVSLCSLLSVVVNDTNDYNYVTYFVSMFVWLGGAYAALKVVRLLHGYLSVELVCNYLVGVCVGQCALALMIDSMPAFKAVVDHYVIGFDFVDTETLSNAKRLYGIGAGLDVAGTRFASVLVIIAVLVQNPATVRYRNYMWLYLLAFIVISVVGNMMARTTTVGIIASLVYWILSTGAFTVFMRENRFRIWKYLAIMLSITLPIILWLYASNEQFNENIRFAFEGFFSLAEKGEWETNSNNILKDMIVFPDNLMTWLIGDGYMENPADKNPYYVGPIYKGFYMGTDIGYIRFIFYFGIVGLATFIVYFAKVTKTCVNRFPSYASMFWLVLLINMVVWMKVSTDIFLVFALFLCVSKEENNAYEKEYGDTEDSIPDSLDV